MCVGECFCTPNCNQNTLNSDATDKSQQAEFNHGYSLVQLGMAACRLVTYCRMATIYYMLLLT